MFTMNETAVIKETRVMLLFDLIRQVGYKRSVALCGM